MSSAPVVRLKSTFHLNVIRLGLHAAAYGMRAERKSHGRIKINRLPGRTGRYIQGFCSTPDRLFLCRCEQRPANAPACVYGWKHGSCPGSFGRAPVPEAAAGFLRYPRFFKCAINNVIPSQYFCGFLPFPFQRPGFHKRPVRQIHLPFFHPIYGFYHLITGKGI